jgi:hypothetical protein
MSIQSRLRIQLAPQKEDPSGLLLPVLTKVTGIDLHVQDEKCKITKVEIRRTGGESTMPARGYIRLTLDHGPVDSVELYVTRINPDVHDILVKAITCFPRTLSDHLGS